MKGIAYVFWFVCFLFLTSCGSSSSPATTTTTTTTEDTVAIEDMSVLPSLDFDAADTTSASLSVPVGKSIADSESTLDGTATAGCYAINFMKPTALAQLKQAEMFKCYVKSMVDGNSEVTVGDEAYNYYEIAGVGDGSQGPQALRARLGNFTVGTTTTFKMDVCESTDGTTFSRTTEFNVSGVPSTKTWTGFATTHFTFPAENQPVTPDNTTITSAFNNSTFTVVMSSAEDMEQDFDIANTTSVETTSTFGRNPSESDVSAATTYADAFQVTFEKAVTTDYTEGLLNTVIGTFSNGSSVTGIDYAQFTKLPGATGRGAAAFQFTNSEMEQSNFDSAESFSIGEPDAEGDVAVLVTDETGADYATLFAAVDAQDLTALTLDVPDDVNAAVDFTESWSCTDADGGTSGFTAVSMTGIDVTACDALSAEISTGSSKGGGGCFGGGGDSESEGGGSLAINGASCSANAGCSSGYCGGPSSTRVCKAVGAGAVADVCSAASQCSTATCTSNVCAAASADFSGSYAITGDCGGLTTPCTMTGSGNGPYTCTMGSTPTSLNFTVTSSTTCTGNWGGSMGMQFSDSCTISGTGSAGTVVTGDGQCTVIMTKQ